MFNLNIFTDDDGAWQYCVLSMGRWRWGWYHGGYKRMVYGGHSIWRIRAMGGHNG